MEQRGFKHLAGDFAAGNYIFGGFADGGIGALDGWRRLIFFAVGFFVAIFFGAIEYDGDQAIGFQLRRDGGGEVCIHDGIFSVSTVRGEMRNPGSTAVVVQFAKSLTTKATKVHEGKSRNRKPS